MTIYNERYRPQFHFSARENWLNDPNGCVFHNGEYHLFFQHNPQGGQWGNITWGHAVSPDLIHWRQLPDAIRPYDDGMIFSGSAVVDSENRSGFGRGPQGPLVAAFTHAKKPFGQAIAFSNDDGRTWQLYDNGRHVVSNQGLDDGERDPKIFWHAPTQKWIMALWVQKGRVRFFNSEDLKHWEHTGDFVGNGFFECPDLFELPVDGDPRRRKWILNDAAFNYWIGSFNGKTFVAETGPLQGNFGNNFYAAQTWNNTGNRIIQIAWMNNGQYPGMPFNQQMSIPCELTLRTTPAGIRLYRMPVTEIEGLYLDNYQVLNKILIPKQDLYVQPRHDLFDITAEVEMNRDAVYSIRLYDLDITCTINQISCLGKTARFRSLNGFVKLRILIDRTSIDLFANEGEICMSSCFLPDRKNTRLQFRADIQPVHIRSLAIHRLSSAWR
ncbi:MAG: glycoside hydrolase family 32 protein [Candidatus Neomarinimicrobiota bacterium]|jgi:sucrose-6-phosphate hydrolase SacC (GH32 family)